MSTEINWICRSWLCKSHTYSNAGDQVCPQPYWMLHLHEIFLFKITSDKILLKSDCSQKYLSWFKVFSKIAVTHLLKWFYCRIKNNPLLSLKLYKVSKKKKKKNDTYLTIVSMLFRYTPSSFSAGKPIAIIFGYISGER